MWARYVWRELVRNPRRTLAALVGVVLGVGLCSSVLFFIDGSGASMTRRAIAPVTIDLQRVLTSPLGDGVRLGESVDATSPLDPGETATIRLDVTNAGLVAANEVVVNDEPPPSFTYLSESATQDGRPLPDVAGSIPFAQGAAGTGLNLGSVAPGATVTLTYRARAERPVADPSGVVFRGTVSTREQPVPVAANTRPSLALEALRRRIERLPGIRSADALSFIDLPPGSLTAGGAVVPGAVRVFGFDRRYARNYPSIRLASGSLQAGAAALSAEAARTLGVGAGTQVELRLPGAADAPFVTPVSGIVDLSRATPLFASRKASNLEDFLYVPDSVVLDPRVFREVVLPAYRNAIAGRDPSLMGVPLEEVDVRIDRSGLGADPATALATTTTTARAVRRIAPNQDYLVDNISNALTVARDDAAVARRMFLFLALPGALLAGFLSAFAGGVLASAHRREQANLRMRGAHRRQLRRILAYRTVAIAGTGAVVGGGVGLAAAMAVLGPATLFTASVRNLLVSGFAAVTIGLLVTAVALYVPGRRALARDIADERGELAPSRAPAWHRLGLDVVALLAVIVGEVLAIRAGAFDAPAGSVYEGRAISIPSHLLVAPMLAWVAGALLSTRIVDAFLTQLPNRRARRFGGPVRGTLARSLRRRSWSLAGGVVTVALITAFGASLAVFASSYDAAKAADARFVVGSDVRVTPSVFSTRAHPPAYTGKLEVSRVARATPVVFSLQNSVITGPFTQDHEDLAAIDPASFLAVAPFEDSFFVRTTASDALRALARNREGVLLSTRVADALQLGVGDKAEVLFARGTEQQVVAHLKVLAVFERFPGFAQGVSAVANLGYYTELTGSRHTDFFLARTSTPGAAGLATAVASLHAGPGTSDQLVIDTTATALGRDQSSLTALNVHGLLDLDSFFTLLMAAAAIAIFVFGMLLQRRREFVTLRAQGMSTGELRALVLGEVAPVALAGLVAGMLVGIGMGFMFVHVLRPLFVLEPRTTLGASTLGTLAGLVIGATLCSAIAATALLRRLRPTELLRET